MHVQAMGENLHDGVEGETEDAKQRWGAGFLSVVDSSRLLCI